MKVKLTKDFAWCFDGRRPTVIPAGTVVESPVAENAMSLHIAEPLEVIEVKAHHEAPKQVTHHARRVVKKR